VSSPRRVKHGTDNTGREKEVFIELEEAENLFKRTNPMTGSENTGFEKVSDRVMNEVYDTIIKPNLEEEKSLPIN